MTNKIDLGTGRETYFVRKWLVLFDGGSDQWLYVAKSGGTYVFLEIIDMHAYCGSDADVQWCAEVSSVELDLYNPPTESMISAVRSCGAEGDPPDMSTEQGRLVMAEMLFSCGSKSPLWSDTSGNPRDYASEDSKDFRALRAEGRRQAEAMLSDSERDSVLDSRIVNAIGQTARQYAQGTEGLWNTLRDIRDMGDAATDSQRLVLKMYSKCETTLGAGPIPADLREEV